ncbi:YdeI/OmpD-associated family protein [Cohnella sp. GCM10027633]|uniref:YdeI/OmpD-associated family protein n=1 Tax=unclassified Cohnella TaxID=2636738 RepID=UPI003633398B
MSKTIVDKLNLNKHDRIAVLNRPEGDDALAGLAAHDTSLEGGGYDMIFAYALDMEALKELVTDAIGRERLSKGGYLYAAYPKKGNKVYPTYIHRDSLFDGLGANEDDGYIGTSDLKFARMVGLDDVFTVVGFKLDPRKREATGSAAAATSAKPSQRVDDYVALIPSVEQDLADAPDALALYASLTPGYRKDWARYVYSAVQEDTREKRRAEMKDILGAGYKSVDLYRRRAEG